MRLEIMGVVWDSLRMSFVLREELILNGVDGDVAKLLNKMSYKMFIFLVLKRFFSKDCLILRETSYFSRMTSISNGLLS